MACYRGQADQKRPIGLVAFADLLLAGRGYEFVVGDEPLVELGAWVAHSRRHRVKAGQR